MKWSLAIIFTAILTICFAQQKETVFYLGRNHFPKFYAFKMLQGIDTLPMNYTKEFNFTEAIGKYDSLRVDFVTLKLDGNKSKLTTPMSPGKGAVILYQRTDKGKYKPIYVHYINVRANRSQFDQE